MSVRALFFHEIISPAAWLRTFSAVGIPAGEIFRYKTPPRIAIHASTQTGVVNFRTARELYKMGARRVVLARESIMF